LAAPVPIDIVPEVPELDVPELKTRTPADPKLPEFAVRMVMEPLDVPILAPGATVTCPPVLFRLSPAVMVMKPPAPLLPLPTVMDILPPCPPVAALEPMLIDPV
jgi:hypothetical protein